MTASRRKPKSRHGCFQCKRRSVKCHEKRPQCSNSIATVVEPEGAVLDREGTLDCHPSPTQTLWVGHEASSPTNQFNIPHLKLLHNWTTSTCHTISRNHADARVWQALIPEKAVSCPRLLHGIFAVSALHPAMTRESKPQINTSSEAIKMFTKVGVNIEPPEQNASFALSSLLIVFAFGFPLATASQHQTKANSLNEFVQIFKLSRKMIKFATPTMNEVHTSEIGGLLLVEEVQSSLSSSSCVVINALGEQLNTVCSPTHEHHQAFADTVACLEKLYVELDGTGGIVSRAFMWSCDVPETFIALVPTSNPFALVIIAHYCVVLHQLRKCWWIASWRERVMNVIVATLGPEWKPSVAWALDTENERH
ncbi:hypothetical protein BDV33DRAFT_227234 [Aspergillus novoparasiticus]|uniref:Zn(2)-C6 fungal-type domain-containing protein n=1 Tax=Aspergillus novoparasiticus TaxID=986946 RepID=A0A5N6F3G9_9EURO|nr:hypothetical protein BDV33DRAFT_227234 [Aspergillus novoparasiticus]